MRKSRLGQAKQDRLIEHFVSGSTARTAALYFTCPSKFDLGGGLNTIGRAIIVVLVLAPAAIIINSSKGISSVL